jgi:hypothetical protein
MKRIRKLNSQQRKRLAELADTLSSIVKNPTRYPSFNRVIIGETAFELWAIAQDHPLTRTAKGLRALRSQTYAIGHQLVDTLTRRIK